MVYTLVISFCWCWALFFSIFFFVCKCKAFQQYVRSIWKSILTKWKYSTYSTPARNTFLKKKKRKKEKENMGENNITEMWVIASKWENRCYSRNTYTRMYCVFFIFFGANFFIVFIIHSFTIFRTSH